MKPVKLTIEGINSFIERQELDFEAVGRSNLFCICGKTGAGKTTIFDSIMLALYGRSGKGNLADVVNLSLSVARVVFEFDANGERYSVERTIKCRAEKDGEGAETGRRTATSECVLLRDGEPYLKGEPATEALERIVGLGESEFKNVYLLEQGEYAEFLKKTPAKQTEAVGKIFSLMRFGDVNKRAGEKLRAAESDVANIERRIADLGEDVSDEALRALKSELSKLRAKNTALTKDIDALRADIEKAERDRDAYISAAEKAKTVKELGIQLSDAKARAQKAAEERDEYIKSADGSAAERLDALQVRRNELSELCALDKQFAASVAEYREKRGEHEKKCKAADDAAAKLSDAERAQENRYAEFTAALAEFKQNAERLERRSERVTEALSAFDGDRDVALSAASQYEYELKSEQDEYNALAVERKKYADAKTQAEKSAAEFIAKIEKYGQALLSARELTAEAKVGAEKAERELAAAQLAFRAAAVRAELKDGDVCPVCGGKFCGYADGGDCDVEQKKYERDSAVAALKDAEDKESELVKFSDKAKEELERAQRDADEAQKSLAAADTKMAETRVQPSEYNAMLTALSSAKKRAAEYNSYASQYTAKKSAAVELKAVAEASAAALEQAENNARALKEKLGELCGKTEVETKKLDDEMTALKNKISSEQECKKKLEAAAEAARAAVETIEASLRSASAECPVDMPAFDEEGYRDKRARFDEAQKQHAEREKEIALKNAQEALLAEKCGKLDALIAERRALEKRADCYKKIAEMTKAKAMLNYVAAEFIEEFTSIASEILAELSGGKYNMDYDRENGFVATDFLNGGKPRKTDTLSGGELFLASLSVAIAIARAQSKGNNAFFFLDEGFGTLDDELIDTVYGALESLSKDCLVGVISHAGALIDRMPSCVQVIEATDVSGSRIEY